MTKEAEEIVVVEGLEVKDLVTKGDRLIVEALLNLIELTVQSSNTPSTYKNRAREEAARIREELDES